MQAHFRTTSSPAPLTPSLLRCCWLPWLQFLLVALALNRFLPALPQNGRLAPPLLYTNLDSTEIGSHGQGLGKGCQLCGRELLGISQVGTYTEKEMARAGSIVENVQWIVWTTDWWEVKLPLNAWDFKPLPSLAFLWVCSEYGNSMKLGLSKAKRRGTRPQLGKHTLRPSF